MYAWTTHVCCGDLANKYQGEQSLYHRFFCSIRKAPGERVLPRFWSLWEGSVTFRWMTPAVCTSMSHLPRGSRGIWITWSQYVAVSSTSRARLMPLYLLSDDTLGGLRATRLKIRDWEGAIWRNGSKSSTSVRTNRRSHILWMTTEGGISPGTSPTSSVGNAPSSFVRLRERARRSNAIYGWNSCCTSSILLSTLQLMRSYCDILGIPVGFLFFLLRLTCLAAISEVSANCFEARGTTSSRLLSESLLRRSWSRKVSNLNQGRNVCLWVKLCWVA